MSHHQNKALTKVCQRCKTRKSLSEYKPNNGGKDGLHIMCRLCVNEIRRLRRSGKMPHSSRISCGIGILQQCKKCELFKVLVTDFYTHKKSINGRQSRCKICCRERSKQSHREYREQTNKREKELRIEERKEAIKAYGGKCVCCDESHWEFLTIDHINGGGTKHRAELGGGKNFLKWIKKQGYPKEGYRLLCYNCNCSRGARGYCPHELIKRKGK